MTATPITGDVRRDVAERLVALSGMGLAALARHLGTTVHTLDRMVTSPHDVSEAVYRRVLPRLEQVEAQLATHKAAGAPAPSGTGAAGLLHLLLSDGQS